MGSVMWDLYNMTTVTEPHLGNASVTYCGAENTFSIQLLMTFGMIVGMIIWMIVHMIVWTIIWTINWTIIWTIF